MAEKNYFAELYSVNVNDHIEKKKNGNTELSYLSWTFGTAEMLKRYPDMTYEIKMFDGKPYVYDEKTGYMVFTSVTIDGVTRDMWLPVMDGANKAMKAEPYTYKTKFGEKSVEACTMFDVNKTIMRCLVKNFAMFGLGLYIYAGEDLPEDPRTVLDIIRDENIDEGYVLQLYKVNSITDITGSKEDNFRQNLAKIKTLSDQYRSKKEGN